MRRHRWKEWLQLLLRTLLLLCLALALGKPFFQNDATLTLPQNAALLLHGGAHSATLVGKKGALSSFKFQTQWANSLDSALGYSAIRLIDITAPSGDQTIWRYGSALEAWERLVDKISSEDETHIILSVWDFGEWIPLLPLLNSWLHDHPQTKILIRDFSRLRPPPQPFGRPTPRWNSESGYLSVNFPWLVQPGEARFEGPNGSLAIETLGGSEPLGSEILSSKKFSSAQLQLALEENSRPYGNLKAVSGGATLVPFRSFAFLNPGPFQTCATDRSGPLAAAISAVTPREGLLTASSEIQESPCNGWAISGTLLQDKAFLREVLAKARKGALVWILLDESTDRVALNRNLLEPAGMGQLGSRVHPLNKPQIPDSLLLYLNADPGQARGIPALSKVLEFIPTSLSQPVIAEGNRWAAFRAQVGEGEIWFWNFDWTQGEGLEFSLGPWPALLWESAVRQWVGGKAGLQEAYSDSVYRRRTLPSHPLKLLDPQGEPLPLRKLGPWSAEAGPFDRLGIHTWIQGRDTLPFAVNLAEPQASRSSEAAQKEMRKKFIQALPEKRILLKDPSENPSAWYGGQPLAGWLTGLALLLLFLEAGLSLFLGGKKPAPSSNASKTH
jgi:hypothetical protein